MPECLFSLLRKTCTKLVFLTSGFHGLTEKPGQAVSFELQRESKQLTGTIAVEAESHSSVSYLAIFLVPEKNVLLYQIHVNSHNFIQNYFGFLFVILSKKGNSFVWISDLWRPLKCCIWNRVKCLSLHFCKLA